MNKSLCLTTALMAVCALAKPTFAQTVNDVFSSKRAALEDFRSVESLEEFGRRSMNDMEFAQALQVWAKLRSMKPKDKYYWLQYAVTLSCLRRHKEALSNFESLRKECASKKEKFAVIEKAWLQALFKSGNWPLAKQESRRALVDYAGHAGVYKVVLSLNERWKDKAVSEQLSLALKELHKVYQSDKSRNSPREVLLKVLPNKTSGLSPGEALSVVAKTQCFPRFKLTLVGDRLLGDSGVVKYIVRAPNYERVVLFDEESKNFLPLTLDQLLSDHCGHEWFQESYISVVKVGERKVLGFNCDIYKCQFRGESGYHLLGLCRDLKVEPGMVRALCHFTYAPETNCVPLCMEEYYMGNKRDLITVQSIKKVPVKADAFELGKGYHQVKDMGELMFSEGGAMKESDLDQFLLSPSGAHSKHR
ncbi:MAG: hypothetical protein JNN26_25515 [Candidatus Obscuribacter sp.]|nr:hypothetical protein [Candidatus Obscuribacter sp.]